MEEIPFIQDITVIFALSIGVLLLCHHIRVPTIVGFLITGILCGPHGLGLIEDVEDVQNLANIGIVLLLFTVGMEFSIKRLLEYKRFLLIGGLLQVSATALVGFCVSSLLDRPLGEAVFFGFLISLSSTAIVMRMLDERGESASPHGKVVLSILILQDILVVPMVLFTPILAGDISQLDTSLIYTFIKGILILVGVFVAAELIVPRLLYYIARTRSRELFLLGILTICSTVAWVSSSAGVSLSLGAFLAGLIISESEYSHEAIGDIIPFQDIFTSFFFVSMGMLLDTEFLLNYCFIVFGLVILIILLKSTIVAGTTLLLGMPLRTAVLAGVALCQVGEFSFVLGKTGMAYAITSDFHFQLFLAVSLLTMALTPSLISLSPKLANYLTSMPLPPTLKFGLKPIKQHAKDAIRDHVIIIGMGMCGKNLARASREASIPYWILDMNPEKVHLERQRGEPIHFGDASHEAVLKHANLMKAKVVVIAINDPIASMRIVKLARKINPTVYLVVRTRYIEEVKMMYQAGADDVIPDEFGSSIEIFTRVLKMYNVLFDDISEYIAEQRSENYEILRFIYREPNIFTQINKNYEDIATESFKVGKRSPIANLSLAEANIRKDFGVTVLLIQRGEKMLSNPAPEEKLFVGDLVIAVGTQEQLANIVKLFRSHSVK